MYSTVSDGESACPFKLTESRPIPETVPEVLSACDKEHSL